MLSLTAPIPRAGLAVASPLLRRSTLLKKQGTTAKQRRGSHEATEGLSPYPREWAGRAAAGGGAGGWPFWRASLGRSGKPSLLQSAKEKGLPWNGIAFVGACDYNYGTCVSGR
jgi:hypothetical protein